MLLKCSSANVTKKETQGVSTVDGPNPAAVSRAAYPTRALRPQKRRGFVRPHIGSTELSAVHFHHEVRNGFGPQSILYFTAAQHLNQKAARSGNATDPSNRGLTAVL